MFHGINSFGFGNHRGCRMHGVIANMASTPPCIRRKIGAWASPPFRLRRRASVSESVGEDGLAARHRSGAREYALHGGTEAGGQVGQARLTHTLMVKQIGAKAWVHSLAALTGACLASVSPVL